MPPQQQSKEKYQEIPAVDIDAEEGMTLEESLAKVAMLLAKVHDPRVLSEVNDAEVRYCAALDVVAKKFDNQMLSDFLDSFLLLRISKTREGRRELLQIAKSAREGSDGRMARFRQLFMPR